MLTQETDQCDSLSASLDMQPLVMMSNKLPPGRAACCIRLDHAILPSETRIHRPQLKVVLQTNLVLSNYINVMTLLTADSCEHGPKQMM